MAKSRPLSTVSCRRPDSACEGLPFVHRAVVWAFGDAAVDVDQAESQVAPGTGTAVRHRT